MLDVEHALLCKRSTMLDVHTTWTWQKGVILLPH